MRISDSFHLLFRSISWDYKGIWDESILGRKPKDLARRMLGTRITYGKWPNHQMIYDLGNLPALSKKIVKNAMRELELNTCFTFKRRTTETKGYVQFQTGSGCSANVGYFRNDVSKITLAGTDETGLSGCGYGAVIHEIIHALGFHHTQTRTDRDDYVTIKFDNIISGKEHNFEKVRSMQLGENVKGREYDYGSIMHYGSNAFGKGGFLGMGVKTTIDAHGNDIGNRKRLSERDVIQLNEHAGCPVPSTVPALSDKPRGLTYNRGVGKLPTSCGSGKDNNAGLCYPKCRSGYKGVGPVCWQSCGGFGRDDGAFCAKPAPYGRGAGNAPKCRSDEEKNGALCYPKCRSGYYGVGPVCWKGCGGFGRDDGAFCAKPGPYGRGAGRSPCTGCSGCTGCGWGGCSGCSGCSSCSTSHCRSSEDVNGLLCYPKCRAGFHNVGCCICSPDCPSGFTDIGVSCAKPSYGRGAGRIPSDCDEGKELNGALCYPKCRAGYHNVGCCICSPDCPAELGTDIGVSCTKKSYGRGVGTIPECSSNQVWDSGLCYPPCDVYYQGAAFLCWWKNDGSWATWSNQYPEFGRR